MVRIKWTKEASEDLRHIYEFLVPSYPTYANKQMLRIVQAVGMLKFFPFLGRAVSGKRYRRYRVVGDYYVFYEFRGVAYGAITINAIVSSRTGRSFR